MKFTKPTPERIATYLARPAVAAAAGRAAELGAGLAPTDVLSFWFGCEASVSNSAMKETMELMEMWMLQTDEFDAATQVFKPAVRALEGGLSGDEWSGPDGLMAKVILADQLSRNVFRGDGEAYKYDAHGLAAGRAVVELAEPFLPLPMASFAGLPLMHSEDLAVHVQLEAYYAKCKEQYPEFPWAMTEGYAVAHKAVIERFGRYPHRNGVLNRETTADEQEWLDSPDRPGWAKSEK